MKRRHFLQGLSGVALVTPFLGSTPRSSHAATTAPKRLVLFHTPGGCITTRWFPKIENGPLTSNDLSGSTIESLGSVVDRLLFPRGITAVNGFSRPQILDPHVQAMGSKLTCALIDDETRLATSPSLDHIVARQLNTDGVGPLHVNPSWILDSPMTYLSFSAANEPVTPISDAQALYQQLTGVFVGTATQLASRDLMRQSALDLVRDDLARFQAVNMSASDQQRVQQWMDLLRQTEVNISTCNLAMATEFGLTEDKVAALAESAEPDVATRMTTGGDLLMDLMAMTLLCDTNRSLLFSYPSFTTFHWDGIVHDTDIDALNHRTGNAGVSGNCYPDVLAKLDQADRWYAGKFLRLVDLLRSIPEGESSLLDNTATVWFREFSDGGAFNVNNMPLIIAGSCGGYLKQGAAVLLEDEPIGPVNSEASCTEPGDMVSANTGTDSTRGLVPINKLFVTLMNAVGCQAPGGGPVTEFGVFDSESAEAGITDPGELTALRA